MKTSRIKHDGRFMGIAAGNGRVLVHYGDLVSHLPSCWSDSLPHAQRINVAGQIYADPRALSHLAKSDAVHSTARNSLTAFLEVLPSLTKDIEHDYQRTA